MKCPKCNYTSFDYLDNCKRCGSELRDARSLLQIIAVSPEDQAPSAPPVGMLEEEAEFQEPMEAGGDYLSAQAPEEDEEILEGLDFDGSFDELVEPTSYAEDQAQPDPETTAAPEPKAAAPQPAEEEEEEELLDLDFGDLFEEKEQ